MMWEAAAVPPSADPFRSPAERGVTPERWATSLLDPPILSSEGSGWRSGLVRRWTGSRADMVQPPLNQHYVVLHLGGRKHVTRRGAGRTHCAEVEPGALTIVPAGARYDWTTIGPIDFAHLYVDPARLNNIIALKFDRDPSAVSLDDAIGVVDPLLSGIIAEMLAQVSSGRNGSGAYLEAMFDLALVNLVHHHSSVGHVTAPARHALAPVRLRRVLDHIEARLAEPLRLADLAGVAGLSRFHFSRAFQNAMGEPPLTYVARRRLEVAKRLLRGADIALSEVAQRAGYTSPSHFAVSFRRHMGQTPSAFRRQV